MAECDAEWELCKENIQPLRHGRTISALHQALCQQHEGNNAALNQKKQSYESELRLYEGDDPLDVWVRYIKWTKQTYPQGGKESNLSVLLQRAVRRFTDDKKYHDDIRYVELWIEFAESCSDPMDIYRFMQAQGIGTMQAALYIAWSEENEKRGNLKMADSIFQNGVKCGAQPSEKLHAFHRALQARVCRQMMSSMTDQKKDHHDDDDDDDEGSEGPQRSSLAELKAKGKKKAVVPINRASASVSYARGLHFKQPLGPKQNSRLEIFDENKNPETEPQEPRLEIWTAPPTARAKENEQKPEKWTNVKLPLKSRSGLSVAVPPPLPTFQPFVEEDHQPPAVTPCKINPAVNSVLSARKPCRAQETPLKMLSQHTQQAEGKTREQSMYCKELLYSGVTEFCFEELRAERYRQKLQTDRLNSEEVQRVSFTSTPGAY